MAVPVRADLAAQINDMETRLLRAQTRRLEQTRQHVDGLARGLPKLEDMLALPTQRLDAVAQRLAGGLQANITKQAARLGQSAARLTPAALQSRMRFADERVRGLMARATRHIQSMMQQQLAGLEAMRRQLRLLSHENVLERGFALVLDESGKPLRRASRAKTGSLLDIRLAGDQHVAARVEAGERSPKFSLRPKTKPEKAKPKPSGDGGQGQLL